MIKYDESYVCKLYCDGDGPKQINQKTGLSRSTIYKILRRNNVSMRTLSKGLAARQAAICAEYLNGVGVRDLGKKYDVDKCSILRYLRKNKIMVRSCQEQKKLRFPLRETAFDEINEESAYWIGVLMSDGCVYKSKNKSGSSYRINLGLKVDDIAHVERFRDFVGSRNKVSIRKSRKHGVIFLSANLVITSNYIADKLALYGVKPHKSLSAKVAILEDNKDFWRGMVDGDGWVSYTKDGYPVLGLCGSPSCCEQFRRFVLSVCPDCVASVRKISRIKYFQTVGRHAVEAIKVLYKDNVVALGRKNEVASSIISRCCLSDKHLLVAAEACYGYD